MNISEENLETIKNNQRLILLLALEFDCTEQTIRRWIRDDDDALTTKRALRLIAAETGLSTKKLLA